MSSDEIVILNDSNWEKKIEKGEKPCVVMFSSPTCPYCKQMKPSFKEYAEEYKDKIIFQKLIFLKAQLLRADMVLWVLLLSSFFVMVNQFMN